MSRQQRPSDQSSISLNQIVASALAASSAAFAASYLGVAGTIIGAAVASVIATVASAMYHSSVRRSTAAVLRTAQLVRPTAISRNVGEPATPDLEQTRVLTIAPEPRARPGGWRRNALAAAAVLGVTLAGLTGLEAALGKPLSALLGDSNASGTSISSAVGAGSHHPSGSTTKADPSSGTTTTPTPTTTPSAQPTGQPTDQPTTEPTSTPTTVPTTGPSGTPTADPTTDPTATPTDPTSP